ncbi:hypothetical protein HDU86_000992 [Geranomyces michiganensis]|nr:hypothetical protein HDU86_000992 [Geranomyces michiganensis]
MSNSTAPFTTPATTAADASPLAQKRVLDNVVAPDGSDALADHESIKRPRTTTDAEGGAKAEAAAGAPGDRDVGDEASAVAAWNTERKMLCEADVGITEYVSPEIPGFTGILKTRFTDFQVNEVTLDGQIVHLVSTEVPEVPAAAVAEPAGPPVEANEDVGFEQLEALIKDASVIARLKDLVAQIKAVQQQPGAQGDSLPNDEPSTPPPPPPPQPEMMSVNIPAKETRTQIHACVRQHFGSLLETQGAEGEVRFLMMGGGDTRGDSRGGGGGKGKNRRGGRGGGGGGGGGWNKPRGGKPDWDAYGGQYTEFTLYKENVDTMTAISKLSGMMKLRSKAFSYAGSKDKRAATTQKVAVSRVLPARLAQLNKALRGMLVGDFRMRKEQITLGELGGNHFKIALRDVECKDEADIERAMCSLRDKGFVNYFGMQRFGTRSLPTYAVGIAYLNGMFKEAVDMIMEPKDGERADVREGRRLWTEDKNAKAALEAFPKHCVAERSVLGYFKQTDRLTDCLGALESIPRNLRTMYLHSYQSLVWNHMVSERLKLYGYAPVVGDLVDTTPADSALPAAADGDIDDVDEAVIAAEDDDDDNNNNKGTQDTAATRAAGSSSSITTTTTQRRAEPLVKLIETEAECALYTMQDVVLPLPGHQVVYPAHAVRDMYKQFMAPHNVDPFAMHRKHKTASLTGSYRKIMGRAVDFAWKTMRYDDAEQDLTLTDMDIVRGKQEPISDPNGKRLALIFELTLKSSQYATMAMREFTKMETAAGHHEAAWNASQPPKIEA